ncbi:MAG: cell division topological specificity factor MinE [Neisseriaceae bacterium]|nr:cell division topological specificity factor MinE [Neisseriaceae bacterium]
MASLIERLFGKRTTSASTARDRLQIIMVNERNDKSKPVADYLPALKKELLEVLYKYVSVKLEDIEIIQEDDLLALNITLPENAQNTDTAHSSTQGS